MFSLFTILPISCCMLSIFVDEELLTSEKTIDNELCPSPSDFSILLRYLMHFKCTSSDTFFPLG